MTAPIADLDVLEFTLGRGSALDPQDILDGASVVAVEVLDRAEVRLAVPREARTLLKHLMLIWSRGVVHGSPGNVRKIEASVENLSARSGWDRQRIETGLGALADHLPVHVRQGSTDLVVIDLTPLLPQHDPTLLRLFIDDWTRRQVDAHRGVCQAALEEIHEALADSTLRGDALDAFSKALSAWEHRYEPFLEGDETADAGPALTHAFEAFWALRPIHERAAALLARRDDLSVKLDSFSEQTVRGRIHAISMEAVFSGSAG